MTQRSSPASASLDPLSIAPAAVADVPLPTVGDQPRTATPLVGRDSDMATLVLLLVRSGIRLLHLTGPAGVGKTRLARAAAEAVADQFDDGTVFVTPDTPGHTGWEAALARTLGAAIGSEETTSEVLATAIGERKLLVVLDDLDPAPGAVAAVLQLLAACPSLAIVTTSVQAPVGTGGYQFAVAPLGVPSSAESQVQSRLERAAAVDLFVQQATRARPDFALSMANAVAVAEICRRLAGIPQAIEMIATHVRHFPPQVLLARLERFSIENSDVVAAGPLGVAVAWTVDELGPEARRALSWLAACTGTTSEQATIAMIRAGVGCDAARAQALLHDLVSASLAQIQADSAEVFVRLPEAVRAEGLRRLRAAGDLHAAQHEHARWYAAWVQVIEPELHGSQQQTTLLRLQREERNLRAALEQLYDSGNAIEALQMTIALSRFWASRTHVGEGRGWLERGLRNREHVPERLRALALDAMSWLTLLQGDPAAASGYAEESLALFRMMCDPSGIANGIDTLGELALTQGEYAAAVALFQESLPAWEGLGAHWRMAMTLMSLGCAQLNMGEISNAASCYTRANDIMERAGDVRARHVAGIGQAWLNVHRGRPIEAERELIDALRAFAELETPLEIAEALEGLAAVRLRSADRGGAERLFTAARQTRRSLGVDPLFLSRIGHRADRAALRDACANTAVVAAIDVSAVVADLLENAGRGHEATRTQPS
jgi:predicted ATPase